MPIPSAKGLNLDANASFGLHPEVEEDLRARGWNFHNPSAIHRAGQEARAAIEEARVEIASLLGLGRDERVIFTSGATEANNMALQYARMRALQASDQERNVVVSAVEHPSTLEAARALQDQGCEVVLRWPRKDGSFDVQDFAAAVGSGTALCSWMLANNETGHLYPVSTLFREVKRRNAHTLCHSDAVQALGKLPFTFSELAADLCTVSAHKIGGLAGVGALVVSGNVEALPLLRGGPQETRWRAGTENVLGIVSFGIAAKVARRDQRNRETLMRTSRDFLQSELTRVIPETRINSSLDGLPNTLHVTIPGLRADDLVVALDIESIFISSGAACASGKPEPSHVLLAMGMSPEDARSSVRLSVRGGESREDLERAVGAIARFVDRARGISAC